MRPLDFLVMLRDDLKCCPQTKRASGVGLPSNGELKQWLRDGAVRINGATDFSEVSFPVTDLVFFPKNDKKRCTIR